MQAIRTKYIPASNTNGTHTPGPWLVGIRHEQLLPVTDISGNLVALADWENKCNHADKVDADAALIAAAPDLLAALTALLTEVDAMTARVGWAGNGGRNMARAAIAKAAPRASANCDKIMREEST